MQMASMDDFIAKWGLDQAAVTVLSELDPDVQLQVLTEFAPHEVTRNASELFVAFARSRARSAKTGVIGGPDIVSREDIDGFVQQWGLNSESYKILLEFPINQLAQAIKAFKPKDPRDINNIFQCYARSRLSNALAGVQQQQNKVLKATRGVSAGFGNNTVAPLRPPRKTIQSPFNTTPARTGPLQIQQFVQKNGLSYVSQSLLEALAPHHPQALDRIIVEYQYLGGDMDEAFILFWQQRAVKSLAERYSLSLENQVLFTSIDIAIQASVIREFFPKNIAAIASVDNLFGSFVKSRVRSAGGELAAPTTVSRKRPLNTASGLVSQWNLSPASEELLRSLTPLQEQEVVERFAPKHNTRNIDGLFHKFVQSIQLKA